MDRIQGLKDIENTGWIQDDYGCLNLKVLDDRDRIVHCWLSLRPVYCDRGHIQLNIDGPLSLDEADSFPRFFFSFREADLHTRTFLKWRLWKHRSFPHQLEVDHCDQDQDLIIQMAKAIYFAGGSEWSISPNHVNPEVQQLAERIWQDPKNQEQKDRKALAIAQAQAVFNLSKSAKTF